MIEPGDQVVLYDWAKDFQVGIAAWKVCSVDYVQGVVELDLRPGELFFIGLFRVVMTKEEAAQYVLTNS